MLKIKGQKPDPMVPPLSVYGLFLLSCLGHDNDVAADEKVLQWTRYEMKQDIENLAKALLLLEVKKGDIVTIFSGRSMYANIVIFFALNRLGAIACFHDEGIAYETLIKYLDEFDSRVLFTYHASQEQIQQIHQDSEAVEHIINMTAPHDKVVFYETILETMRLGSTAVDFLAKRYREKVPKNIFGSKNEALISWTSGSTSGPKPMVFTNENLVALAIYAKDAAHIKMWDKDLHSWMSYVHLDCPYGLVVSILAPLCGGGEIILTPDINDENISEYFRKGPNTVFGIPQMLEDLPKLLDEDVALGSLKSFASGGEKLEKQLSLDSLEFFKSRGAKDVQISNGYGVGEALGLISTAVGKADYIPESVGKIPAGVHVAVHDVKTGKELGFNDTGILYVTGKHVLNRYFNRPELDAEKILMADGRKFVKTGDLAWVSEEGYITLVGRATFFINKLPAKVYYEVVNTAVEQSPIVKKSYVVKGPDITLKLAPYAFVVLQDGVAASEATRQAILGTAMQEFQMGDRQLKLKAYEIPKRVIFLDALPLTPASKIDFRKLEKMAEEIGD